MIRPTKYTNLNLSLLNVSSIIIEQIKENKTLLYDELLNRVTNQLGNNARFIFTNALVMLFAIGCLNYDPNLDAIYFIKKENETK